MAEIFLARTSGPSGFEKLVVLKKILPKYADKPTFVQLFLDEARLAASLDHPHVAQVYDIGMSDGSYFFTMEYLHGQDVRSILHRTWRSGALFPFEHAVQIARHVASALHFAHDKQGPDGAPLGIVHRDVSPSNMIVTYDGATKLLDFGVAKTTARTVKTRTGALKGKISYMSPEQARGAPIDRRSDIFSLGIVLWEMVTTQRLYRGENDLATLQLIITQPARAPSEVRPDVPPELERIVLRALARNPDDRYATAEQLVVDLDELAREHKLKQSSNALATTMNQLFAAELGAWREARAAGVPLAEHLHDAGDMTTPVSESDFIEFDLVAEDDDELELEDDVELDTGRRPGEPWPTGSVADASSPAQPRAPSQGVGSAPQRFAKASSPDTPRATSQGVAPVASQGIPREAAQGAAREASQGIPRGAPREASQGIPREAVQGAPREASQGIPREASQGIPRPEASQSPREASQGVPRPEASQGAPREASQGIPREAPQGAPREASQGIRREPSQPVPREPSQPLPRPLSQPLPRVPSPEPGRTPLQGGSPALLRTPPSSPPGARSSHPGVRAASAGVPLVSPHVIARTPSQPLPLAPRLPTPSDETATAIAYTAPNIHDEPTRAVDQPVRFDEPTHAIDQPAHPDEPAEPPAPAAPHTVDVDDELTLHAATVLELDDAPSDDAADSQLATPRDPVPVLEPPLPPTTPYAVMAPPAPRQAGEPFAPPPWHAGPGAPPVGSPVPTFSDRIHRSWAIIDLPAYDPETFARHRRIVLRVTGGIVAFILLLAIIAGRC